MYASDHTNWPSYDDGSLVHAGETVRTDGGDAVIDRIDSGPDGWQLMSVRDGGYRVVGEGRFCDHPSRAE